MVNTMLEFKCMLKRYILGLAPSLNVHEVNYFINNDLLGQSAQFHMDWYNHYLDIGCLHQDIIDYIRSNSVYCQPKVEYLSPQKEFNFENDVIA